MYSPTFIARDILGEGWGVLFVGALANADSIEIPFDSQYYRHAHSSIPAFRDFLKYAQAFTDIQPEVLDLGITEGPWTRINEESCYYQSHQILSAELSLILHSKVMISVDYKESTAVKSVLESACIQLATDLMKSLFEGRFCFSRRDEDHSTRTLVQLMEIFAAVKTMSQSLECIQSGMRGVLEVYQSWRKTYFRKTIEPGEADEAFQEWLKDLVNAFDQRCDPESLSR